ncbi:hypothetical protein ABAC460_20155 [Asticcacaulis sp. AC460]|uniref:hypothetical protein n=1 Tax=Asticcacaulis sp. AC460 TaxID=1282360 RepID=UPI0003C3B3FC|nr:hypothetical protein [Asticcacaulis sp. AC460]ESQ87339.1 hypothetical protein ABAC460_20155 [Asticcacaulis sp. AC460]
MSYRHRFALFTAVTFLGSVAAGYALATHPFSPSRDAVAYAVDQGCLTWLREGGRIGDHVRRNAKAVKRNGRPAQKIVGQGQVTVEENDRGGCYVRAARGKGADLRDQVLNSLAEAGLKAEPFADYEPVVHRRNWSFVQETYCFRMNDQVFNLLVSSSATGDYVPLQVTMHKDNDGAAAKLGLCQKA